MKEPMMAPEREPPTSEDWGVFPVTTTPSAVLPGHTGDEGP
jgi:hypothetical protein